MLDLSGCHQITNIVVRSILQGCGRLEELSLNRCYRITDNAFDAASSPFTSLVGCQSLLKLSLQGCSQISGSIFIYLKKIAHQLTHMNVCQCKQIEPLTVSELFGYPHLTSLNLSFIDSLTDDSFPSPGSEETGLTPFPCNITELWLNNSKITDQSMQYLCTLSQLTDVRLPYCNNLTDEGIIQLVAGCGALRLLDVKSSKISDRVMAYIKCHALHLLTLDVSWCGVTDMGMRYLCDPTACLEACPRARADNEKGAEESVQCNTVLEELSVVWCSKLTAAGLMHCLQISSLRRVDMTGCVPLDTSVITAYSDIVVTQ